MIDTIRAAVIGEAHPIKTPFGYRPLVYADYVASGRGLTFIEDLVREVILPDYGNTHTETSYTGRQTTLLRELARETIRKAVGASDRHAVIFTGSGATAAVNKLCRALQLQGILPRRPDSPYLSDDARPVVFVGPYEHHSNDLPWRESGARICRIPLNADGGICFETLERELKSTGADAPKIGVFSAASNVTGIKTDVRRLARLLHDHDALFCCDYAAGAPYMQIAMAETTPGSGDHIDAVVLSPHKYIGGPGASGLLICDKAVFDGIMPTMTGGGTVSYVTADGHRYVSGIERREEAGTPNIVGDIKAGLALELQSRVGAREIERREASMAQQAMQAWSADPNIEILGSAHAERIGIFAFNIRCGSKWLHYGFVVALLNDLFGIQARGGCSCAGPYGHALLNINDTDAARYESGVSDGQSIVRPGWVRLGFNYFFDQPTQDYIIEAVRFVAAHGAAFLPLYKADPRTGVWSIPSDTGAHGKPATLFDALMENRQARLCDADAPDYSQCLAMAGQLSAAQSSKPAAGKAPAKEPRSPSDDFSLFWSPEETEVALNQLIERSQDSIHWKTCRGAPSERAPSPRRTQDGTGT
ncbi:aminotransferase class V-fold PLP-dependent enzyme [uncultured Roseibium sp.]|uniref:aminotransferase class V-fold PLP-dependent enzyme n=1 Tax=uncultured Roseibium sp. TaxID=1936171 RepID=UPI0032180DAE